MSIITSVYGEVAADGNPVANGENWWGGPGWDNGTYAGAFSSEQTLDTPGQYKILFAPGTFAYDPKAGVNQPPALVVTAGSVSENGPEGNNGLCSPKTVQWSIAETRVGDVSVSGWVATIIFVDASGGLVSTPFSFVATGPLGEALLTTISVTWNSNGTISVEPSNLNCKHPMTLEWVPRDSEGNRTTAFYITAILGLPSTVFGIPEGEQEKGTTSHPLIWKAFNNCPEATSSTPTVYQYTIFAARKTTKNDTTAVEVAYLDPRITNGASTGS